jgi:tRNA pseudouridine55 synthase
MTKSPTTTEDPAAPATPVGLVLLDKPTGHTSHDCVARVRRAVGVRKAGHAGTLDPTATGLLVVGVGRATRFLTYLVGLDKRYTATIRLGEATTTDDAAGERISRVPAGGVTAERLEAAARPLRGRILQIPSQVSAVKVDGVRAYARVRAGERVALPARPVRVDRFEVLATRSAPDTPDLLDVDVVVDCSSGTYVRALARDLGAALGVGGHLTALRRERVGPFAVTEATGFERLGPESVTGLGPAAEQLFPVVRLSSRQADDVAHGRRLADAPEGLSAAIGPDGALWAMVRREAGDASGRPEAVFR